MLTLWLRWVGANAVGESVGLGFAFVVGLAATALMGGESGFIATLAFAALIIGLGTLEGVILGWMQQSAMHKWLPYISRSAWIGATALGACIAWCLGMIPSTFMDFAAEAGSTPPPDISEFTIYALAAMMGMVLGPLLGVPQWLVLRKWISGAWWWIPANALAWMVGMPVVFAGASSFPEGAIGINMLLPVLVTLALAGAVVGAIHGMVLVWLVAVRRQQFAT